MRRIKAFVVRRSSEFWIYPSLRSGSQEFQGSEATVRGRYVDHDPSMSNLVARPGRGVSATESGRLREYRTNTKMRAALVDATS